MLQALLAERLALAVHREHREEPIYAVEIAKSGSKLRQADGSEGNHQPGAFEVRLTSTTKILTGNLTVAALLRLVAPGLGRQMIDATGLKDTYEFKLEWTPPDFRAPGSGPPGRDHDGNVPTASMPAGTDLFVALEKAARSESDRAEGLGRDHCGRSRRASSGRELIREHEILWGGQSWPQPPFSHETAPRSGPKAP